MRDVRAYLRRMLSEPDHVTVPPFMGEWPTFKGESLEPVFSRLPELSDLDDSLTVVGSSATKFSRADLARWMYRRAQAVGEDQAVQEVNAWLDADHFVAYQLLVVQGVHLDEAVSFAKGIDLLGPHEIPSESVRDLLASMNDRGLLLGSFMAAFVRSVEHPRVHHSQGSDASPQYHQPEWEDIEDAWRALCIATKSGIQRFASTVVAADHVPVAGARSWSMHSSRTLHHPTQLVAVHAATAASIHSEMLSRSNRRRRQLRVPMERLSNFAAEWDPAQRAIELRIALEALLLTDSDQGELRFRLALRGALLLDSAPDERGRRYSVLRDAYDLGSKAIHTGQLTGRQLKKQGEALKAAAEIAYESLGVLVRVESVDWQAITLGAGDASAGSA